MPFSHVFTELQISPIEVHISPIEVHISPIEVHLSPIQLHISTIQLEISPNRRNWRYLQINTGFYLPGSEPKLKTRVPIKVKF